MSVTEQKPTGATSVSAETQRQRWVKYGLNVALSVVVVVVLAGLVVYLAQRSHRRIDMTAGGVYSLKPQTLNVIRELKTPIKIVSLYRTADATGEKSEYAQAVADLLEEYKSKGRGIDVAMIDPVREKDRLEDLHNELIRRYGSEIRGYRDFLNEYAESISKALHALADAEAKAVAGIAPEQFGKDEQSQIAAAVVDTLAQTPEELKELGQNIQRRLKDPHPNYKSLVSAVQQQLELVSQREEAIAQFAQQAAGSNQIPAELRRYLAESVERHRALKNQADDVLARAGKLGELRVDQLERALNVEDPILVLGENDWRILTFGQVWQADEQSVRSYASGGGEIKPRFAGEQQITTSLLTLSAQKKPKVVFIRPGGGPLTNPGFPPFQPSGPLSRIAEHLRAYNFDVLEKDLSGTYAMQAQMRGMPAEPEPSDDQMKDAVWVVLALPSNPQQMRMGGDGALAAKLAAHLKNGGSALVLASPEGDGLSAALDEWGVRIDTGAIAVHEAIKTDGTRAGDMVEEAQRIPFIFVLSDYGQHMITQPLKSLDGVVLPMVVVQTTKQDGYQAMPILPVPAVGQTWGSRQIQQALEGEAVQFDAARDISGPLFGGAVVEKQGEAGGRLVVLGSVDFVTNGILRVWDPELLKQGLRVSRFPGNAELFANSVFWLAKADTLIAISPAAMEVSRIRDIPAGTLRFWHYGVLLGALPGLVVLAGLVVYLKRRD